MSDPVTVVVLLTAIAGFSAASYYDGKRQGRKDERASLDAERRVHDPALAGYWTIKSEHTGPYGRSRTIEFRVPTEGSKVRVSDDGKAFVIERWVRV